MATHQIPMDPPRFLFVPARPLVCGLAIFGAVRSFVQFWMAESWGIGVSHVSVLLLDLLLLFGAYKNDVFALKWSQRVVFACVIIALIRFLVYPVVFASFMASGLSLNRTAGHGLSPDEVEIIANVSTPEQHFVLGLISGFTLELATGLSIGVECLKYLMVHRLWEYAKATEAVNSGRYVIP
ncbi:unnamed protein product [Caenorhabditis sp. 36 PRJEB53466]|nr:unnamed protein product [Caenorhabditis sp. 36 PRJEB53466]